MKGPSVLDADEDIPVTTSTKDTSYWLTIGTPVVCYGLKNAQSLNEKIGDVRGVNEKTGRYEVHFEDTTLKPPVCYVKLDNLKILFELPEKDYA